MRKPIDASLREFDAALQQEHLASDADARIVAAMREARRNADEASAPDWSNPWRWGWAVTAAVILLCFGGGLSLLIDDSSQRQMGGLLVVRGAVSLASQNTHESNALQCDSRRCRLRFVSRRTKIALRQRAQIQRVGQQLSFARGIGTFDVSPRRAGEAALRIRVSHGIVEVLGTRFTIEQGAKGGVLHLYRGRVVFHHLRGPTKSVSPGESISWPLRLRKPKRRVVPRKPSVRKFAVARPMRRMKPKKRTMRRVRQRSFRAPSVPQAVRLPAPARPASVHHKAVVPTPQPFVRRRPPRPSPALTRWIQELARYRSQRQFSQAASALRRHLRTLARQPGGLLPGHQHYAARERLHYELGSLLTHYLSQRQKACVHWRQHLHLFPRSRRYHQEVLSHLKQLKCR